MPQTIWRPNPGPQERFLASGATEACFGGAAGGGKTDALLYGSLRYVSVPSYRALFLRRSYGELETLVDRSGPAFRSLGGSYKGQPHPEWTFPSGAKIMFRSMDHRDDRHKFRSDEYQLICFDELTTFEEVQYRYLFSRLRSPVGLPCIMRAGTNPGGIGHEWVLKRWAAWLYRPGEHLDEYQGPYARDGEVLWFRQTDDGEEVCPPRTRGAVSRVFIRSSLRDNPALQQNDPEYAARLERLDRVTRAQLLGGDWMARSAPGEYFRREWFLVVPRGPEREASARVRWWDRAGSKDGDWTVGLLLARSWAGNLVVEDVVRFRGRPAEVEARIVATAKQDAQSYGAVRIALAQDPGQAGLADVGHLIAALDGFDAHAHRETGDKVTRAKPVSAQAEAGHVHVVKAPWNGAFFEELEAFPGDGHDDQVDALSGAHGALSKNRPLEVLTGGAQPLGRGRMGGF